jgi:hypothetical protein
MTAQTLFTIPLIDSFLIYIAFGTQRTLRTARRHGVVQTFPRSHHLRPYDYPSRLYCAIDGNGPSRKKRYLCLRLLHLRDYGMEGAIP